MSVSNQQISAHLKGLYPFRTLPYAELEDLIQHVEQKFIRKGETLYEKGQEALLFVIPFDCKLKLERINSNSQYETFCVLDPGEFGGLEAVYPGQPYETRAVAHSDGTVLFIQQRYLSEIMDKSIEFDMYLHMLGKSYYPLLSMRMSWRQDEEAVFWSSRKHPLFLWVRSAIPLFIGIVLLAIYLILLINDVTGIVPLSIVFGSMLFVVVFPILYFYLDWADDFFIVTDRRVISRNRVMLLYETNQETHIDAILSVNKKVKNIWAATVDYGDIIIRTYTGTLLFEKIPTPNMVSELIDDVRNRQRSTQSQTNRQEKIEEMRKRLGYAKPGAESGQSVSPPENNEQTDFSEGGFLSFINSIFQLLFQLRTVDGDQITYRTHWFMLLQQAGLAMLFSLIPILYLLVILISIAIGGSFYPPLVLDIFFGVIFLIAFLIATYQYIDWRNDRYIVNNRQIIDLDQKPFGREDRRAASLSAIQSVEYKRLGFFGIVLNYGTVYIRVGDIQFTFDNVPNPSAVQQEIAERIQVAKDKERQDEIMREQNAVLEWIEIYHAVAHKNETNASDSLTNQPPKN